MPEASAQSADAKAASGSAGPGTTVSIQVYRSSYPLVWDLNDEGSADETKASWASKPAAWPTEGSPGSAVGTCDGYVPWTDDSNPGSEPSRLGFNFMGWSTKPDIAVEGTGKLDTLALPKDAPIVEGADGVKRITLYALWAPVEYSVVFDLTKNPEDASAVPSFSWTTGKGAFSDLGGGRYRLSGVTLEDYDPATGLIEMATPARGTGGYRFLSWAEPESQQDPAVAVMKAGSSKWHVNPVALPHYSYEPVLTARWALSFDVDVPSQVTFDQYDSLEVEGNLTDTTEKDAIDEESADPHDAGRQAHFCSQSTACDYKIVALRSVRQPTADDVLTTSDSSKATHDEVLGGERLLSLFAAGATSESQGVHFKLDDAIDMDDSTRYGAFTIPKQTKSYADSDYARDDENRLYVSYRLNLDNKVNGASEPNHGLVVAKNVQEGDRTPIAEVSYEFAVADDEVQTTLAKDCLYITEGNSTYDLAYIKHAAEDLSNNGTSSRYYSQFKGWLDSNATFVLTTTDDASYGVRIVGICQDTVSATGKKAGLTFGFKESFGSFVEFDTRTATNWQISYKTCSMKSVLDSDLATVLPSRLSANLLGVTKSHRRYAAAYSSSSAQKYSTETLTEQTLFVPSYNEVFGANSLASDGGTFQYQYYAKGTSYRNMGCYWWTRSALSYTSSYGGNYCFYCTSATGGPASTYGAVGYRYFVVPHFCL